MNYIKYLKFSGIFLILELMIALVSSFLNLIGVNSGITSIVLLLTNSILFFFFAFKNGITSKKNGIIAGLGMGLMLIVIMFLINLIMNGLNVRISTLIYYLILIIISILGGIIGINKKKED